MPNTDFPKYIGLAGRLTDDIDQIQDDMLDEYTELATGSNYPAASQELNSKFASVINGLSEEDETKFGSELYIRLRDVAHLIQAVRKLHSNAVAGPIDLPDSAVAELTEALERLTDIPDNATS